MQFITLLVQAIIGGIMSIAPALIARIMFSLGVGVVSYAGLDILVGELKHELMQQYGNLPSGIFQFLEFAGITTCINILIASLTSWATIKASSKALSFIGQAK